MSKESVSSAPWYTHELRYIRGELLWVKIEHKVIALGVPCKPTRWQRFLYSMAGTSARRKA